MEVLDSILDEIEEKIFERDSLPIKFLNKKNLRIFIAQRIVMFATDLTNEEYSYPTTERQKGYNDCINELQRKIDIECKVFNKTHKL